jgi:hypothetical protein
MKSDTVLPQDEIDFLQTLTPEKRNSRLAALHEAGWSLSVLSRSTATPKTTVHFWIKNAPATPLTPHKPVPQPSISITKRLQNGHMLKIRTISPKVPPDLVPTLRDLSTKSRRYRSRTPAGSPIAVANRELTRLALNLHSQGVSTAALAEAAGVSYRAMARRIALGGKNS